MVTGHESLVLRFHRNTAIDSITYYNEIKNKNILRDLPALLAVNLVNVRVALCKIFFVPLLVLEEVGGHSKCRSPQLGHSLLLIRQLLFSFE